METPNLGGKHRFYNKQGNISWRGYLYEAIHDFVDNINLLKSGKTISELKGSYPSPDEGLVSTKVGEAIHESIAAKKVLFL
jgi:hypothetical protein